MVRHSQKQIEEAGIGKVKESLWDLGEFADSYFETNDKTPLIDGEIFLYKKGGQSNIRREDSQKQIFFKKLNAK